MSSKKVDILKKENLHNGFLQVNRYTLTHSLYNGGQSAPITRELVERGHAVAILLHDPARDEIILIEQFRIGAIHAENSWMTELVAGMIDTDETPETAARREALEESGAIIKHLELITEYYCSVGGSTETTTIFYGQVDASAISGIHGVAEENEDIRVVRISRAQFNEQLKQPKGNTASLLIAGLWLQSRLPLQNESSGG